MLIFFFFFFCPTCLKKLDEWQYLIWVFNVYSSQSIHILGAGPDDSVRSRVWSPLWQSFMKIDHEIFSSVLPVIISWRSVVSFFHKNVHKSWLLITKTCLYNFDPFKPHFYIVKLGFTGVCNIFLISAQKHRLWVLVRTTSPRRL